MGAFDAIFAAVALNRDVEALVSAAKGFGAVPGLPWVDASSLGVDALLARS